MSEQDELFGKEWVKKALIEDGWIVSSIMSDVLIGAIVKILAKVKQHYEPLLEELRTKLMNLGTNSQRKLKQLREQKRLDRPELRELATIIGLTLHKGLRLASDASPSCDFAYKYIGQIPPEIWEEICVAVAKEALALFPDIEELSRHYELQEGYVVMAAIKEAKEQEQERIAADLKPLMAEAMDISDWSFVQEYVQALKEKEGGK